jgi:hypothetical protein
LDRIMPPAKRLPPKSKSKRPAKRGAPLVDALAQAAWAEADIALAEAIVECDRAIKAKRADARSEALALTAQALSRAARRRSLVRLGKAGSVEAFDPLRHQLALSVKRAPTRVRVVEEGIARGGEVLVKARAKPARAKRT